MSATPIQPPEGGPPPLLEARRVSKRFGAVTANKDVDFIIREGERHALLGENGAGKSTLVKMIYGVLQPSDGVFLWRGSEVTIPSPAIARKMGVGMVFQHFSLFEALSVAENVALSLGRRRGPALEAEIAEISDAYGLAIDPRRAVHSLGVGERQRVEIIRCLLQEPRLLIMDEPTSVLTPQEAEALFETLRRLSEQGCAVLYISHKLDEVRQLCEAATILRRGEVVARVDPRAETARSMAETMVGAAVAEIERKIAAPHLGGAGAGPVRLKIDRLSLPAETDFGVALRELSLQARGGEIVGVAGVAGEGQTELMTALIGERAADRPEAIVVDGKPIGRADPTRRRAAGAAFVPEERNGHAAIPEMSLGENMVLSHHGIPAAGPAPQADASGPSRVEASDRIDADASGPVARRGWIDFPRARAWAKRVRARFDVRAADGDPAASSLSGGNLQKFVVGREILRRPGVLVVSQPTWGVDAGAAAAIRQALVDLAAGGAAVVAISQDLEEIFAIADRVAVIHQGQLSAAYPVEEMTPERVGLLMSGAAAPTVAPTVAPGAGAGRPELDETALSAPIAAAHANGKLA